MSGEVCKWCPVECLGSRLSLQPTPPCLLRMNQPLTHRFASAKIHYLLRLDRSGSPLRMPVRWLHQTGSLPSHLSSIVVPGLATGLTPKYFNVDTISLVFSLDAKPCWSKPYQNTRRPESKPRPCWWCWFELLCFGQRRVR